MGFVRRQKEDIAVLNAERLKIEGQEVTGIEHEFPPFQIGDEYILFLRQLPESGHYAVAFGPQGAFQNLGGQVRQVAGARGSWNRERGRVPMVSFIEELTGVIEHEGVNKK